MDVGIQTGPDPVCDYEPTKKRGFNLDIQKWVDSAPNGGRKAMRRDSRGFVQTMLEKEKRDELQDEDPWHADEIVALNDERLSKVWGCWEENEGLFHILVDASKRDLLVCKKKLEHPRVKDLIVLSVD
jgi:hypothetical protein